jgi:hypothetical protein
MPMKMRAWLVALACYVLARDCVAQTEFLSNTTINYTFTNSMWVGKGVGVGGFSPTVNIVGGADIWDFVAVFNASTVNISGGRLRSSITALDTSTVSVTGGEVGAVATGSEGIPPRRGGTILMTGGTANFAGIDLKGTFSLHGGSINGPAIMSRGSTFYLDKAGVVFGRVSVALDSQAYISGGQVLDDVVASFNARISINGGTILDAVLASGNSTVSMTGGDARSLLAEGKGTATLGGGSLRGTLSANQEAVVNMTAGGANRFYTDGISTGNIYGGVIEKDVTAFANSTINIYGGTIGGEIHVFGRVNILGGAMGGAASFSRLAISTGLPDVFVVDDGVVQFFGSGLAYTLLDPSVAYEAEGVSGVFSKYALTGVLSDGTEITGTTLFVQNGTGGSFAFATAVPEPESYLLVAAGLLLVLANARHQKR